MPRACLPHPRVDFVALMASFVGGVFPTIATQHQDQVSAVGLCVTIPPVCFATRGDSAVPMGSWTYSFHGFALWSLLVTYLFIYLFIYFFFFGGTNFIY